VNDPKTMNRSATSSRAPVAGSEPPLALLAGRQPPIRVMELELSESIPDLTSTPSRNGMQYRQALVLVRLHREPIGLLPLDLPSAELPARQLADVVWGQFHEQIDRHLRADGQPPAQGLPTAGLPQREAPCAREHGFASGDAALVSVVVTTCDRPIQLLRTLDSLLLQTYPAFELIVVDNRPGTALTRDAVSQRYGDDSRVRYVAEHQVGLSAARNAGLAHAHGEIVAFTDDDVMVDRHWLSSLAHAFLQDKDVACVTGLILPLELETTAQLWFEQFGGFSKGFEARSFDLGPNRPPDPLFPYTAGRFGSGANSAFRTDKLRALGGFAVDLSAGTPAHGGEDLDAYLNIISAGYRLVYEPRALVWHPHHPDLAGLSRQIHRYGIGLSAALTRRFTASREERRQIIRRLPAGLAYALHPRSVKNIGKGSSYPTRLTILELAGMLRGPIAYGLSRRSARSSNMTPPTEPPHPANVEEHR
jgi:GT2 family glycosyltransferase